MCTAAPYWQILSQKNQFKVIIAAFPVIFQVQADFVEDTPQRILAEISKEHQFYYTDLLPYLRIKEKEQNLFFDYAHLNEVGSLFVAEFLTQYLQNITSQK